MNGGKGNKVMIALGTRTKPDGQTHRKRVCGRERERER